MPATDDHGPDPFEGLTLDEDFVRGAVHKEQSARTRMLAARWKHSPPQPQDTQWRAPVVPIRKRHHRRRTAVLVLLAAGLVLAVLNMGAIHDWAVSKAPGTVVSPSVEPPLTASPTAAPAPAANSEPTVEHPFAGSPALHWPSGAAGIALPPAKPVGALSASTVADDERLVKKFLVAAYLDPRTIAGAYPQGVLDLLGAQQRAWLLAALRHPTAKQNALLWVSRFDPRTAVPIGSTVKVRGLMSLSGDADHGLLIHADYLFVYASHPADGTYDVERSIARRTLDFRFYDPNRYATTPGLLVIEDSRGYTGDQRCDSTDGYLLPYFQSAVPTSTATGPAPSGRPVDPYDMSKPVSQRPAECALDSRS